MKTATIKKVYWPIVESMGVSDIRNGYFGGSNLTADYLNDYSADGTNRFLGEWMDDYLHHSELSAVDLLESPDYLLQTCAAEFVSALAYLFDGDGSRAEWAIRNANTWFDAWGQFFVYANADIACLYIIRAGSESEAFEELTTRFESAFAIDEEDADEETPRNDNGTPINTDYLQLIGVIQGADK